jgi:hypothetical protein
LCTKQSAVSELVCVYACSWQRYQQVSASIAVQLKKHVPLRLRHDYNVKSVPLRFAFLTSDESKLPPLPKLSVPLHLDLRGLFTYCCAPSFFLPLFTIYFYCLEHLSHAPLLLTFLHLGLCAAFSPMRQTNKKTLRSHSSFFALTKCARRHCITSHPTLATPPFFSF